jgi:hypothetical protein
MFWEMSMDDYSKYFNFYKKQLIIWINLSGGGCGNGQYPLMTLVKNAMSVSKMQKLIAFNYSWKIYREAQLPQQKLQV